ncbi:hypothetical protein PC129_g5373 [Phytophthora cactorum]|uniref:Uncharacterized protein n=1 Tax=Phytophthora cactorum TaxID=29920 RepID=A0A8T1III6_9STRA|nr:hypothetical protein PC114_g19889 [Phytophthora cactorum]KAG3005692.1 hypothetical protein PC120_g17821 [Phytophthora cactorum]KAG3223963.1 hypothetical protein PC129_g5373 [Phytophthora cactorum]
MKALARPDSSGPGGYRQPSKGGTLLPPFSATGSDDDAAASDSSDDVASDGNITVGKIHENSSSDTADAAHDAAVETEKECHNSMKNMASLRGNGIDGSIDCRSDGRT